MNDILKKQIIRNFLASQRLATIATVTPDHLPEAAVIEFAETADLEIIFITFPAYRKYQNLHSNPRAAFAIGWDDDITVQYEGIARELGGEAATRYQEVLIAKHPHARKFTALDASRTFLVTPAWIRYSDLSPHPWDIFEMTFPSV